MIASAPAAAATRACARVWTCTSTFTPTAWAGPIQGVGSALLFANSTALVTDAFPASQRGFALGINSMVGISGFILGTVIAGNASDRDYYHHHRNDRGWRNRCRQTYPGFDYRSGTYVGLAPSGDRGVIAVCDNGVVAKIIGDAAPGLGAGTGAPPSL